MTVAVSTSSPDTPTSNTDAPETPNAVRKQENLRILYQELCTTYRSIDDFRAKLLGALPLATAIGIFLVIPDFFKDEQSPEIAYYFKSLLPPIALFGFVITLGLLIFEIHGIRRCTRLITVGKYLERELGQEAQFVYRAKSIAGFISEPLASGVIYSSVAAVWAFLGLYFVCPVVAIAFSVLLFLIGTIGSIFFLHWIRKDGKRLEERLNNSSKVGVTMESIHNG
jgi:hypothetical protein